MCLTIIRCKVDKSSGTAATTTIPAWHIDAAPCCQRAANVGVPRAEVSGINPFLMYHA